MAPDSPTALSLSDVASDWLFGAACGGVLEETVSAFYQEPTVSFFAGPLRPLHGFGFSAAKLSGQPTLVCVLGIAMLEELTGRMMHQVGKPTWSYPTEWGPVSKYVALVPLGAFAVAFLLASQLTRKQINQLTPLVLLMGLFLWMCNHSRGLH